MNAIQAFVPLDIVKTFAAFLEFCYIARRNIITDDSLEKLKVALNKFHEFRKVFLGTVREDGPSAFSLPRQHSMVHYYDHIKNFGSPNGLCSSITESKHIAAVKRPWRRSNKHAALPQMLKVNERLDKLAAARVDFTARNMLSDSCLIHAIKNAVERNGEDPMDEDASDSDETDSDISDDAFDPDRASTHGPVDAETNADADTPNTANPLDDADPHTLNAENNHYRVRTPTPPNDAEDNDHGPVESGPLMNEVRLMSKKGQ